MISLATADSVLKNFYLDAINMQINGGTNPFLAAIEKSSEEVSGKDARVLVNGGINGGISSGDELGSLPASGHSPIYTLTAPLRNLYGKIELSDKALRASRDSAGSLVNLLEFEVSELVRSAKYNFGRMLWQNGSAIVGTIGSTSSQVLPSSWIVTDLRSITPGIIVDFYRGTTLVSAGHRITRINPAVNKIFVEPALSSNSALESGDLVVMQKSLNKEIFGLPYMFDNSINTYYGLLRDVGAEAVMPMSVNLNAALTTEAMQSALDDVEERTMSQPNIIVCSKLTRRKYLALLTETRVNVDFMNMDGGFKAVSYNGIPLYAERFCEDGAMYMLNTNDFKLVQLCDWQWIEGEGGGILRQNNDAATYSATLVKYANLMPIRPKSQTKLYGIQ